MASSYLLGLDIGSSSVKASLVHVQHGRVAASAQSPSEEMPMLAVKPGWAEQDPDMWWTHAVNAVRSAMQKANAKSSDIKAIGISYQMHGLVVVDKQHRPVRPSIIWCDSRAVGQGDEAFRKMGSDFCLQHYLNSPGNFTASKLRWVQENEPSVYERINKLMLPGDYIALRLTGELCTTDTGLSEGILWDYPANGIATDLLRHYQIDQSLVPSIKPVFSVQGTVMRKAAEEFGISEGIPVSYRAGDQPNNAYSLNVLNPGETAATAGTSGVIYGVTEKNAFDQQSRVNTFIHVTNGAQPRRGVLLCVNGTGILNSWLRRHTSGSPPISYESMNQLASTVPVGADGLSFLPFGNGAERMLGNRDIGASLSGLSFNQHSQAHIYRAAQEGIVFALAYGFEILRGMGLATSVIRAGKANMFLSPLFREAFVNSIGANLEFYDTDGARGAALGAGVGAGVYASHAEAFAGLEMLDSIGPDPALKGRYSDAYGRWKERLNQVLRQSNS